MLRWENMEKNKKIKYCLVATNGLVACQDENGEQITELQGFILDIAEKLKEYCDENTKWRFGIQDGNVAWYWIKRSNREDEKIEEEKK